ncbi:hypothetical protein DER30_4454 [Streptomyces sp. HB202]|nr:hypothetical protein DER30_4454 [Streptomyces sp. HB202]
MVRRLAVVFFTAFLAVFFAAVFFAGAGSAVFLAGVRLAAARFGDAASAAASSVSAPAFDRAPELDSRWARTNHWNCSRPAQVLDEQILRDGVDLAGLLDRLAVVLDDPGVDEVEGAEVGDGVGTADAVVVPGALPDQGARSAVRLAAEGGDALGGGVRHVPYGGGLRVEHLVDGDEVRSDHVPVDVLEGEREVVERVQAQRQEVDDLTALVDAEAGHGVAGGACGGHGAPVPVYIDRGGFSVRGPGGGAGTGD